MLKIPSGDIPLNNWFIHLFIFLATEFWEAWTVKWALSFFEFSWLVLMLRAEWLFYACHQQEVTTEAGGGKMPMIKCHRIYDCGFLRSKCYFFLIFVICYVVLQNNSSHFWKVLEGWFLYFFSLFVKTPAN